MSLNFTPPSVVIKRLKTARAHISKTDADFQIWGAADFEKAQQTSYFAKDSQGFRVPVLIVAVGNHTGNILTTQGSGSGNLTHNIDVHFIAPLNDRRGQFRDEESVWFKQFLLRSLHAFNPSSGANPMLYSGDSLTQISGVAAYCRTYTFAQSMIADESDVYGGDENNILGYGDLDDFIYIDTGVKAEAPDFGTVSPQSDIDTTLHE